MGLRGRNALAPELRTALNLVLVPVLDGTKTAGAISLPGAMPGLNLAGVPTLTAVRYQIVVMCMLLCAGALSALTVGLPAQRSLFDIAHCLRRLTTE